MNAEKVKNHKYKIVLFYVQREVLNQDVCHFTFLPDSTKKEGKKENGGVEKEEDTNKHVLVQNGLDGDCVSADQP